MDKIEFLQSQIEGNIYLSNVQMLQSFIEPLSNDELLLMDIPNINISPLIPIYSWKNGQHIHSDKLLGCDQFCSWGYLSSMNEGIQFLKRYNGDPIFKDGLFPFISSHAGEYLFLDTNSKNGGVYSFAPSLLITEMTWAYDNLETFFESVCDCYEKGAYKFQNNVLEVDYDLEQTISQKRNRRSNYWIE